MGIGQISPTITAKPLPIKGTLTPVDFSYSYHVGTPGSAGGSSYYIESILLGSLGNADNALSCITLLNNSLINPLASCYLGIGLSKIIGGKHLYTSEMYGIANLYSSLPIYSWMQFVCTNTDGISLDSSNSYTSTAGGQMYGFNQANEDRLLVNTGYEMWRELDGSYGTPKNAKKGIFTRSSASSLDAETYLNFFIVSTYGGSVATSDITLDYEICAF